MTRRASVRIAAARKGPTPMTGLTQGDLERMRSQLFFEGAGWSIDAAPTSNLVTNALAMAIENRTPKTDSGLIIHSDQGPQFNSWAFTTRARNSGLVASMGGVGFCFDNAVIESFWGRMQTELLDRRRWRTRVELANAVFEYLEIFHNRQRRHSALGMLTPNEFELAHSQSIA
jgi:transposase InsO family protein